MLPKNDSTRKMKDFDNFTKFALKCGWFGQNSCCHRLWKVVQSAINHPIWSHWQRPSLYLANGGWIMFRLFCRLLRSYVRWSSSSYCANAGARSTSVPCAGPGSEREFWPSCFSSRSWRPSLNSLIRDPAVLKRENIAKLSTPFPDRLSNRRIILYYPSEAIFLGWYPFEWTV